MVNIFIKSFNRVFYLDRCLQSIETFVEGNCTVKILDDGTPEKYLQKIKEKHPNVEILKSENYQNKILAIEENLKSGKEIDGFTIPTELWINAVKNATDYFIITEDDVWFTQKINVDELQKNCKMNNIFLLKMGWLGNNKNDINLNITEISPNIEGVFPKKLILLPGFLNHWFFQNKYHFFSFLYKLKLVNNYTKQKYWVLNSIMMGLWQKEYWLAVWKDAHGKVDEAKQLENAAAYFRKNKHDYFFARTKKEIMKTTFQSSATNSYHQYGINIDINLMNHLLNEAWFNDELDAMENFPKDFSSSYFEDFLKGKIGIVAFRKWVEKFKTQYRNLGCETE